MNKNGVNAPISLLVARTRSPMSAKVEALATSLARLLEQEDGRLAALALLKSDALREARDQRPTGHSSGGKLFLNLLLKRDAMREEKDPPRKEHSERGKQSSKCTCQKICAEEGQRPTSKRTLFRRKDSF